VKMNVQCRLTFFLFHLDTAHNWHLSMKFLNFIAKNKHRIVELDVSPGLFPKTFFFFLSLIHCNFCISLQKNFRTVETYQIE